MTTRAQLHTICMSQHTISVLAIFVRGGGDCRGGSVAAGTGNVVARVRLTCLSAVTCMGQVTLFAFCAVSPLFLTFLIKLLTYCPIAGVLSGVLSPHLSHLSQYDCDKWGCLGGVWNFQL